MKDTESSDGLNNREHINTAFEILPTQLLADVAAKRISEAAYTFYGFLLFWQGSKDHLWYGLPKMAEKTGFSEGKIKRLLKELLTADHIKRVKRMGANWWTRCRTYVDKTGTVFVAGEPVIRGNERLKEEASYPKVEEPPQTVPPIKLATEDADLYNEDTKPEIAESDAWMAKVGWTEDLTRSLKYWVDRLGPAKGKREFLNEQKFASREWLDLFVSEYPEEKEMWRRLDSSEETNPNEPKSADDSEERSKEPESLF